MCCPCGKDEQSLEFGFARFVFNVATQPIANPAAPEIRNHGQAGQFGGSAGARTFLGGVLDRIKSCAADDDAIVFDGNLDGKYERAMRKIGIDLTKLSGQAGHA